jgi:hypothetical protein
LAPRPSLSQEQHGMAMTVGEITAQTRTLLDVGTDELPDSILHLFIQEGFDRILERKGDWRHLQVDETVTTVADTRDYTLSSVVDIRQVVNTSDAHSGALMPISSEVGESLYTGIHDVPSWPRYWSTWDDSLELWPTPDQAYTLKVRGYRAPEDFVAVGAGAEPDLPAKFHIPLWYWVVACSYDQQEDPEMSTKYQQKFEEGVAVHIKAESRGQTASPLVLNGQRTRPRSYRDAVTDLTWAN